MSRVLEQHERQKVRCTANILLIFLATVKLGRRSIEDKYELVLSDGEEANIWPLSLSLAETAESAENALFMSANFVQAEAEAEAGSSQ